MSQKLNFFPDTDTDSEPIPSTELESPPVDTSHDLDTSPISIDLDAPEDKEESLLPEGYDAEALVESSRTRQHPVNSGWFKAVVVLAGVSVAFGVLMLWYNSARSVNLTKENETKPVHLKKDKAKVNKNSDRISNAVQTGKLKREKAYANLQDKEKEQRNKSKSDSTPPRSSRSQKTSSIPTRSSSPPPVRYPPPPRSRITVPSRVVSVPRVSPPPPQSTPSAVASKPVDRSPLFGGQLPQAESASPATDNLTTSRQSGQFVSNQTQSIQPDRDESANNRFLVSQQQAFLQGQTMTTIPSGSTLEAEVKSESIADDSATFTAVTTQEIPGIPVGSEVTARIVQLASGGYFEAEVIALNDSELPPGTTRIARSNGDLLQAKGGQPKKGFFQTDLGGMIKGFAQDAGESWIQDKIGGNQALSNLSRDVIVLADRTTEGNSRPTAPQETSVLIPRGDIMITFQQDAMISR